MALPAITGPESHDRNDPEPPAFKVWPGANRFFAVEVAGDTALFNQREHGAERTPANYFASWETGLIEAAGPTVYALPPPAWKLLRAAPTLYFRVLTSAVSTGWVKMETSLPLDRLAAAPSIQLKGRFLHLPDTTHRPEEELWRAG